MQSKTLWLSFAMITLAGACDLDSIVVGDTAPQTSTGDEPQGSTGGEEPQGSTGGEEPQDPLPATPTTLLVGEGGPLAVDDTWLFVGSEKGPLRLPKLGGEAVPVVPEADLIEPGVDLIALDDTHVYWSVYNGISQDGYPVFRAPKEGGAPTLIYKEVGPNVAFPVALAVDDGFVYLSHPDIFNANVPPEELVGVIRRVPKEGGASQDLAPVYSRTVAVDADHVYWPRRLANGGSELIRAAKDGSSPQVLVTEAGVIDMITARGGSLFWTVSDAGLVLARAAIDGGAPITLAASETYPGEPAVASDAIYWLIPGGAVDGKVIRVTFGGELSELVTAPTAANSQGFGGPWDSRITVDEEAVYWAYDGAFGGAPRLFSLPR